MKNKYIKKISLETVESFFGINVKKNMVSLGFDVAQYHTGISMIKTTNSYLTLEIVKKINTPKLPRKANSKQVLNGFNVFIEQLDDFKNKIIQEYTIDTSRIEDCFFGSNIRTLKTLARYSILAYDRFRNFCKDIDFILPNSARSKVNFKKSKKSVKGKYLKKEIMEYINTGLGTEITDHDIADSVVLALVGLLEE